MLRQSIESTHCVSFHFGIIFTALTTSQRLAILLHSSFTHYSIWWTDAIYTNGLSGSKIKRTDTFPFPCETHKRSNLSVLYTWLFFYSIRIRASMNCISAFWWIEGEQNHIQFNQVWIQNVFTFRRNDRYISFTPQKVRLTLKKLVYRI